MRGLGILLLILCACKPASKSNSQSVDAFQELVNKEVGASATVSKNNTQTFALAIINQGESIQYAIIRLSDNKIVIKNKIRGGISWSGNMQLTESRIPGIVKKDSKPDDYSRTIDLNQYIVRNN